MEFNLSFQSVLNICVCVLNQIMTCCVHPDTVISNGLSRAPLRKILLGHFIPQSSLLKQKIRPIGLLLPVSELFNRSYQTDLVTQAVALRRWRTSKNNISSIDIFNVWQRSNPRGHRANGEILSVARTEVFF